MLTNKQLKNYQKYKKIALAVSGGRDSMALLHSFIRQKDKLNFFVITIHHNLRGDEGKRDRDFVKQYCFKNNIECVVFEEDINSFAKENKYTIEQAGRIKRREIFTRLIEEKKADAVALAHHKQDQIESVLMHIFRGCGLKGLCGMQEEQDGLIRPLLERSREEINKYIEDNNIPYVDDSSNEELCYNRNKIRNIVLKDIEDCYPNVGDNILRLSEIAKEAQDYINIHTPKVQLEDNNAFVFIEDIKSKDIVAKQCIINAVEKISTRVDFENCHLESIFQLIEKENGKKLSLPFNVEVFKEYDKLVFTKTKVTNRVEDIFKIGITDINGTKIEVSFEDNGGLRADYEQLKDSVFRYREVGDKFKRFKGGTKSLGDYLTDIKIPQRERDNLIVIAKEHRILAVLPYEISDDIAVREKTKNIVYIKIQR